MALQLNHLSFQFHKFPSFSLPPMASIRSPTVFMASTLRSGSKSVSFLLLYSAVLMDLLIPSCSPPVFGSGFLFFPSNLVSECINSSWVVVISLFSFWVFCFFSPLIWVGAALIFHGFPNLAVLLSGFSVFNLLIVFIEMCLVLIFLVGFFLFVIDFVS